MLQSAGADLAAGNIEQNRHLRHHLAEQFDRGGMPLHIGVRTVEASHVGAGFQQGRERGRRVGARSDRSDDFHLTHCGHSLLPSADSLPRDPVDNAHAFVRNISMAGEWIAVALDENALVGGIRRFVVYQHSPIPLQCYAVEFMFVGCIALQAVVIAHDDNPIGVQLAQLAQSNDVVLADHLYAIAMPLPNFVILTCQVADQLV